jgi:hypothetical protein
LASSDEGGFCQMNYYCQLGITLDDGGPCQTKILVELASHGEGGLYQTKISCGLGII